MEKKTIFSAMQPSGVVTLGNFLGAIQNWSALQEEYHCLYAIADLHALTVRQQPEEFRDRCIKLMAQFLACGLDAEKNTIFFQSHVSAHAELGWILNCYTYMGEMNRMTQFKEKSARHADNINVGLFDYPVLMAADILLYRADLVPVGADQKQHLEICRDIAMRFNKIYGEVFTVPEAYIGKTSARIMSLQDPGKKMSKSDENPNGFVSVIDEPDKIMKKFKKAVTDSENQVLYREDKEGICNLLNIYCGVTGASVDQAVSQFENAGYGAFKTAVGEAVVEKLRPIREAYLRLMDDPGYLEQIYSRGAAAAEEQAQATLQDVYRAVGLVKKA
ncbi:MAG: tryptophan--tRNA ligase [Clostridia bacterium]|nr:tryptophan--tRNA ligase [Clostridia bacterium]